MRYTKIALGVLSVWLLCIALWMSLVIIADRINTPNIDVHLIPET